MKTDRTTSHEVFIEAIKRTFSEMAFIDVSFEGNQAENIEYSHVTYLAFTEPVRGYVALFLPLACKKRIVENIYGEDWQELQSDQIDDCLLELLNVFVGNYLSDEYGEETPRDIGLPQLLFDESEMPGNELQQAFFFDAEGAPFKAVLEIK